MSVDPKARAAEFAEHAHRYASLGWALIRLNGKRPKDDRWQKAPPGEPGFAAGEWSHWGSRWNMGAVLGRSRPPLAVVEPDTPAAHEKLLELLGGELPVVPTVKTGGRSLHLYFRDGGQGNAALEGLELRAGAQQCVLPPSVHPDTGRAYAWLPGTEPWVVEPGPIPDALLEHFFGDERRKGRAQPIADELGEGDRHHALISLAGTMRRRGMSGTAILAALRATNEERCRPPLPDDELEHIAEVAEGYEPALPLDEVESSSTADTRLVGPVEFELVDAASFATIDEPDADVLLGTRDEALLAAASDAMLYGDGGAGKTTLSVDLACHLAAGIAWLELDVPRPLRVLLVEAEGSRGRFRLKVRRKLGAWDGPPVADRVQVLTKPWGALALTEPEQQQALAAAIERHAIELVIVGPLTAVGMDAPGTIAETRAFLAQSVEPIRELVGRPVAFLFVHHESKGGKVSGAWEGVGDTLLHLSSRRNGAATLTVQKARHAGELNRKALALSWAPGDTFVRDEDDGQGRPEKVWDGIAGYVLEHGGCSWNEVDDNVPGEAGYKRRRRDQMLEAGVLVDVAPGRSFELWHRDDPTRPQELDEVRRTADAPADDASPGTPNSGGRDS